MDPASLQIRQDQILKHRKNNEGKQAIPAQVQQQMQVPASKTPELRHRVNAKPPQVQGQKHQVNPFKN